MKLTQTQTMLIVALLAAAAIAYFLYDKQKKDLSSTVGDVPDAFTADDTAAYNAVRADVPAAQIAWVDPYVKTLYDAGTDPSIKIGGRKSKLLALMEILGRVNPNEKDGKYIDKSGNKVLLPQTLFDKWWTEQRNPFTAKYGGLA